MTLAPPKPTSNLAPGYRLDRYELLCPIAQGGMAAVWVGRQHGKHGFEKLVAIKTILPEYASDLQFQKMFLDEAHIAAGIEHPNVAQILDLGEEHDVLYIAMEYVDGDAISKLHRAAERVNVRIPHGVLLRAMADACAGLHAAHELRDKEGNLLSVVHRDVSPQNILVSHKGSAKVIDFGIAKARDRMGGETASGMLKGKIQYMAPEQALGKPVDRRADIWAMGAILYHLLSGRRPYDAENPLATLHLLTSRKPPMPLSPAIPRPIVRVVQRAMAFDPQNRFLHALEMQLAIEAAMIECELSTTNVDVAAFISLHLSHRQARRRQSIDLALKAAAERARVQQLLRPPTHDSLSGVDMRGITTSTPPPRPDIGSSPGVHLPSSVLEPAEPSGPIDVSGIPTTPLALLTPRPMVAPVLTDLSSEEDVADDEALTSALPSVLRQQQQTRRKRAIVFGGIGFAGVALLGVVAIVFASRGKGVTEAKGEERSETIETKAGTKSTAPDKTEKKTEKSAEDPSGKAVATEETSKKLDEPAPTVTVAKAPTPTTIAAKPPATTVAAVTPTPTPKPKPTFAPAATTAAPATTTQNDGF